MRVAVYYNNRDVRVEEKPVPKIGAGELLVKIHASGICGSDVMEWYRIHKAPLVLGHEIGGEVVEVGAGVTNFKIGDRVAATHHVPCNTCHFCLNGHECACETLQSKTHFDPGGFCEYTSFPAINVDRGTWKIPDSMTYEEATFVEPIACVYRGQRLARVKPGASVLVLGSGVAGMLHIALAKALGAGRIVATDVSEYRLKAALKFGADTAIKADKNVVEEFKAMNNGLGADFVIVCASATAAFNQSLQAVERGGTILFFAGTGQGVTIPVSVNDLFWRREITITSSYAGGTADCVAALELIRSGRVNVKDMVTHRFGLADTVKGFKLVADADESIKVIINPQK